MDRSLWLTRENVEHVSRQLDAVNADPVRTLAVTQDQLEHLGVNDGDMIAGITVVVWEAT